MQGNWSLEFLRIESSMLPSATRHRTAPGSIRRIGVRGMRALKWRLHRRKLLTTSSSGCKKQIGTKKKLLIMSIIERIFVPNSTTFEERRSTQIVSLRAAMLPRGHLQLASLNPAPQELFIPASAALAEPASRVFGRF